jgi:transcriptional regulator with XRE-family HTH domain
MPDSSDQRRKSIGLLLRRARETAGSTRKECAAFAGIATPLLTKYEDGEREPSLVELELLAHFLRIPVQSLLDADVSASITAPRVNFDVQVVSKLRTNIIGTRLKQARLHTNKSSEEIAAASGINANLITAYESGRKPVPITELERLISILGISFDSLLDIGIGPLGESQLQHKRHAEFDALPDDIRTFVSARDSLPYLRIAMHLSRLPAEELRNAGRSLIELSTFARQ